MPDCKFIVPINYVEESNNTLINKISFKIIDCIGDIGVTDPCNLWSFNKCLNDDDYCQPFIEGDKMYFQYAYDVRLITKILPLVYDTATEQPIDVDGLITIQDGTVSEFKHLYNVVLNSELLPSSVNCFYVKLHFYLCEINEEEFNECVLDKISEGIFEAFAKVQCADEACPDNKIYSYSEPYCRVACQDKTILLTGDYTKYDCDGNYYGDFGIDENIFKSQVRIYGEVVMQSIGTVEVLINNVRKSTQKKENYTLLSKKLPYYVVKQVSKVFNSQTVLIDGTEYKGTISLNKNFDEGSMWILKEPIYRLCDIIDFTCK